MSKTKHSRKKAHRKIEGWAVLEDGKPVVTSVATYKIYGRKADAQSNCWMGGQEVRRVSIRVIG